MSIKNNSIVVSLSVSQWTARKLDKKITDEVNSQHNATNDAGRYNKLLVAKEFTEAVQKVANKARVFHYENTLCWGDNNERLLPSKNYFTYINEINKLKGEFQSAVAVFLSNYDNVIEDAKRRLNGMFREQDYPTRSEIEEKFGFKTTFMPVPDNDFRVQLSTDEVDKLRESLQAEITDRLTQAVDGIWDRIKEQLKAMKDRLSDEKSIFRDSLFENLKELIDLLPKLNVTNDINIAKVCNEMQKLVVAPDAVRNNTTLRNQKATEVNDILNKFGAYFK